MHSVIIHSKRYLGTVYNFNYECQWNLGTGHKFYDQEAPPMHQLVQSIIKILIQLLHSRIIIIKWYPVTGHKFWKVSVLVYLLSKVTIILTFLRIYFLESFQTFWKVSVLLYLLYMKSQYTDFWEFIFWRPSMSYYLSPIKSLFTDFWELFEMICPL